MGLKDLFFPEICPVCERLLVRGEKHICTECLSDLPYSYFWNCAGNPAHSLLTEKIPVESVATLMIYRKESNWKNILYDFKYSGDKSIGRYTSGILGKKMVQGGLFNDVELIIPVPLHPLKKWIRGFNQASVIAYELSKIMEIPVAENILKRGRYSISQTLKDRKERSKGVSGAFYVKRGENIDGKHVLLVDDVLTTGATAKECGMRLVEAYGVKLSFAALAFVE